MSIKDNTSSTTTKTNISIKIISSLYSHIKIRNVSFYMTRYNDRPMTPNKKISSIPPQSSITSSATILNYNTVTPPRIPAHPIAPPKDEKRNQTHRPPSNKKRRTDRTKFINCHATTCASSRPSWRARDDTCGFLHQVVVRTSVTRRLARKRPTITPLCGGGFLPTLMSPCVGSQGGGRRFIVRKSMWKSGVFRLIRGYGNFQMD